MTMIRVIVLAVATLAPIVMVGCGGVDRDAYVLANARLFAGLPRLPGARLESGVSTAYHADESGPVIGYGTRFELTLPMSATRRSVSTFFRRRLESVGWRLVETLDAVFNFRRGKAFLSLNLENARVHMLEIAVDYSYYGKLTR